jgi:hypothetical protein
MEDTSFGVIILLLNAIIALAVLYWCNKKIKELTDKDN